MAADGCPDPAQSCVVVKVVSTQDFKETTTRYEFNAADLAALSTTPPGDFYVRDEAGKKEKPAKPAITKAVSIRSLLGEVATRDPAAGDLQKNATFSEVSGDDGIPRVLDYPAFADPNDKDYPFDDGLPAVVYPLSGERIGYFRPLAGKDDVNRGDWIVRKGRLYLVIHMTGKLLQPTVSVDKSAPTTKDKLRFDVSLTEEPNTRVLKYEWNFGDGRAAAKKSPKHRYTKRGTYGAFVSIRGGNGSYGRSDVVTVKVAKPPKPPKAVTPGTGGAGTGSTGGTGGGYVPPYVAPVPGLPGAIDDPPQDDPVDDEPVEDIPVDDGLVDVEGYVLAGAEIVPGGTPETIPGTEASAAAPENQTSVRSRIATWTVAALTIALLVGAGAASETRWLRNRLRPLRRRA